MFRQLKTVALCGFALIVCLTVAVHNPVAGQDGSDNKSSSSKSSNTQSSGNGGMTVIHIAASVSSPSDAKRIATGFQMARHSAQAGRETLVYLNGGSVKLATTGLSLAKEITSELNIEQNFSQLSDSDVQVYAATTKLKEAGVDEKKLRSGVKTMSPGELFKRITPDTVVLSF